MRQANLHQPCGCTLEGRARRSMYSLGMGARRNWFLFRLEFDFVLKNKENGSAAARQAVVMTPVMHGPSPGARGVWRRHYWLL